MVADKHIEIHIDDRLIPAFIDLELIQEIDAHHSFVLTCRKDVLESNSSELLGESIDFLGKSFLLRVQSVRGFENEEELEFKGIVTEINTVKGFHHDSGDIIHIKGKSTSIITDDGPHYTSHKDIDLSEIVSKTFTGYNKGVLQCKIAPTKSSPVHYTVQQEESAFAYASRLASQYGQWFYYDGKQLVFGKPDASEAVTLRYGYDLKELSVSLKTLPNNFKYFTNDYLTNSFHSVKTNEVSSKVNGVAGVLSKKSDFLFNKETQVFVSAHDDPQMKMRMDEKVAAQKQAQETKQVLLKGTSTNPSLKIGSKVNIEGEDSFYGNYRVTKIEHSSCGNGSYINNFEAITSDVDISPKTSLKAYPKSKQQTATVISNNDPKGMGRVQVQHAWQKPEGETTPWVRISNTAGGPGQGFFFVPEVGDEVIVGYEHDNAEVPIVQGSVYNSSSVPSAFKSGNNHLKAIKTRSGNQVTLNDADGSVTIADPSGNTIVMGGNGEITVNAPNKITFTSKDIAIDASNDITVSAGNNISSTAATDISASAGSNYNLDAGSDLKAKAGSKAVVNGSKSVSVFGKRVSITGSIMTNIQSGTVMTIVTAGALNLTGAVTSLLNGAFVKILGNKVDIN